MKKFAGVALGAILIVAVWFFLVRRYLTLDLFIRMVNRIRGNRWAPLLFVIAYALACLCAPISAFPVAGGVLFGFWKGFLFNALGANGGAFLAFLITRIFRHKFRARFSPERLENFNRKVREHGFEGLLIIRVVGLPPFIVTNYLSGLSSLPVGVYLLATFIGMLPWKIFVTYSADMLWHVLLTSGVSGFHVALAHLFWPMSAGFIGLIALTLGVVYLRKKNGTN